jgi:hypothetical protein
MTTVFTSALGVPIDSEGLEEGCNRMPAAALGADVTILNPSLDPDDRYARRVVDHLAAAGEAPESA